MKVLNVLWTVAVCAALYATFTLIVLNIISGCGQTYHLADGKIEQGECIGISYAK